MATKPRKGWRVDLKWLFGILATVLLTVGMTSYALYRVASNPEIEKYKKLSEKGPDMTALFGGFADPSKSGGKNPFKIKINGKEYTPQELDKMPEAEAKKLMAQMDNSKGGAPDFGNMPFFGGSDGKNPMEALSDPAKMGEQMSTMFTQTLLPMVITSASDAVKGIAMTVFIPALLVGLIFLTLMVVVSYRFGRITSFALCLLLASLPVFVTAMLLKGLGSFNGPVKDSPDVFSLLRVMGDSNFALFLTLVIASSFLLIVSILLSMIFGMISSKKTKPPKTQAKQAKPKAAPPLAKVS